MTRVSSAGDEKASLLAGHAGIVRELIDGITGDHCRAGPDEAIPARPGQEP